MELAENFFSQKSVARGRSVTPFFGQNALFPPPPKNCLSSKANIGSFVQNFNNGSTSQLWSIFSNYGAIGNDAKKLFCSLPQRDWGK